MENLGRYLIIAGLLLILVGAGLYLAVRLGLPLGHLPGDIRIGGKGGEVYVPVSTSIAISLVLTLILNLAIHILRK